MKIGITCYPTYGGSGAVATELGIQLAERGHEVHFVSYAQPFRLGHFRERVYFHEVEMEQYPLFEHPPYSLALAVALHETARKEELDLLHVHYAIPHATSAWIAREMLAEDRLVPVVTTLHGTDITLVGLHPSFHSIVRFSILRSQGITAVSKFLRDETVRDFGVPEDRIEVIPNFIDPEVYRPGKEPCHRATLAPEGEKILMHVSNFRPVKRVVDVVEIFARVRREVAARLVFVGDGPDRPRAQERADELGVADAVTFLGKHASVDELLACCDLFLLPSENESFGLAALEAMASGAPVVASRTGGIPELVPDGEAGYLLPVGDVEGMADAAIRVLRDEGRLRGFREAARRLAVERFSAERLVPRYEAYYRSVLEGASVAAETAAVGS
ncbi:MAG TPA: N-acetyl-alpha-D-glucosaminyl L-malate synthase BshA [Longimicrobiales bacterium]|nr:N-acetyl-alpha-D-glucosaminyl L-malate synthase BshA [Longimicrobiales bacterium]